MPPDARPGRLRRDFFQRQSPEVARELLGMLLFRMTGTKAMSGVVVETEAYGGRRDPASHAYRGITARNSIMFGEAGHAYVYFTMGLHHCLNVTTGSPEAPGAVLLRAIEPVDGLDLMLKNRNVSDRTVVSRGPGNLAKALRVDLVLNGEDLAVSPRLFFVEGTRQMKVGTSPRIGVTGAKTRPWRFFVRGNPCVSGSRNSGVNPRTHNYLRIRPRNRGVVG